MFIVMNMHVTQCNIDVVFVVCGQQWKSMTQRNELDQDLAA